MKETTYHAKDLKFMKSLKVEYGCDEIRKKSKSIEVNGIILRKVDLINIIAFDEGFYMVIFIFMDKNGKEIARSVIHENGNVNVNRVFGTYIISDRNSIPIR